MSHEEPFDPKWFTSPLYYEEGLLLDRKQELYDLKYAVGQCRFLKHVIALANSARRLQRPARMLLGINDIGEIRGLDGDFAKMRAGKLSDFRFWEDKVKRPISTLLRDHVAPYEPQWGLKHGIVDGKLVAYMLIEPVATPTPYRVKKAIGDKNTDYLDVDACFIRSGESSRQVELRLLLQSDWNSVGTYVLPRQWERYFEALLSTPSFLNVSRIAAYQDAHLTTGQTLTASLQEFVNGPQRLYILTGDAGVGKTTSVLHWMNTGATNTLQTIEAVIGDEEFQLPPDEWIYVHYSLRKCNGISKEADLTKRLVESVNDYGKFWRSKPRRAEMLLDEQQTRWLLFLDGFDEMPSDSAREKFLDGLRQFLDRYTGTKAIVTSRPVFAKRDWSYLPGCVSYTLTPFSLEQIHSYITSVLPQPTVANLWQRIEQDHNLAQLSAYPTFLEALVTHLGTQAPNTLENLPDPVQYSSSELALSVDATDELSDEQLLEALVPKSVTAHDLSLQAPFERKEQIESYEGEISTEILRLGSLLNCAYRTLWSREQLRGGLDQLLDSEWWDLTGELALDATRSNDRVIIRRAMQIMKTRKALRWLLNLGVVREMMNAQDQIEFMTILTQLYFSASKLNSMSRVPSKKMATQRLEQVAPQHEELLQQIYFDITGEMPHFDFK